MDLAQETGARIVGIVGRDGGHTARVSDACIVIPTVNEDAVTPHTEGMQSLLAHLLASHPRVAANETKWESVRP